MTFFFNFAGQFYHTGQVCWEDPTGLINKESKLTTRRVLSEFYFKQQQHYHHQTSSSPNVMKDFFLNQIGVDRFPPATEYLVLVNNISSKTQLPNPTALRDILRLFQILGSLCIQEDMKETLYQWRLETNYENNLKVFEDIYVILYVLPKDVRFVDTPIRFNRSINSFHRQLSVL